MGNYAEVDWATDKHDVCQAFGTATGNQIQLLATTLDPRRVVDPTDTNGSYGLAAWRLRARVITTGSSNGTIKGSNGKFPITKRWPSIQNAPHRMTGGSTSASPSSRERPLPDRCRVLR